MTRYELIKDFSSQFELSSLVNAGLVSYITRRNLEAFEEVETLSKSMNKEEAVKIVCQKHKISRALYFTIQSDMRSNV